MIRNSRSKKNKNIFYIKYKRNLVDRIVNQSVVRAHNNGLYRTGSQVACVIQPIVIRTAALGY